MQKRIDPGVHTLQSSTRPEVYVQQHPWMDNVRKSIDSMRQKRVLHTRTADNAWVETYVDISSFLQTFVYLYMDLLSYPLSPSVHAQGYHTATGVSTHAHVTLLFSYAGFHPHRRLNARSPLSLELSFSLARTPQSEYSLSSRETPSFLGPPAAR